MDVRTNFSLSVWLSRKHCRQLAGELGRDANLLQDLAELPNQLLLADVRVAARTAVPGAVVVDVLALLRLRRKRASASPAGHESGKRVSSLRVARMVGRCEDLLHAVEEVARDDRLVEPLVQLSEPVELAVVDRVLQDLVDLATVASGLPPVLFVRPAAAAFLVSTFSEHSPEAYHSNSLTMIGARSGSGSIRCVTGLFMVAHGRNGGPVALPGLLDHPLANFLAEVVDVVLRHQDLDAVHEFLGRPRVFREDDSFLDEMDLDAELVDRHPILDVAVQTIGLLDQEGSTGRSVLAKEGDHFAERRAASTLRGFDVLELLNDVNAFAFRVLSQQLPLRRDRESLLLLFG